MVVVKFSILHPFSHLLTLSSSSAAHFLCWVLSFTLVFHFNFPFFPSLPPSDIKMMASLVMNSIRSALDDLERRRRSNPLGSFNSDSLKCMLNNLETFVLCARRLGDDAQLRFDDKVSTLGSLLERIHHPVSRVAQQIEPYCRDLTFVSQFQRDIKDFEKEMSHWYNTLSDYLPQPTFHEVTEIIDSVSEALGYFARYGELHSREFSESLGHFTLVSRLYSAEVIEAMVEKMTSFRNFIRFATLPSVEPGQLENLLLHIQAVTVDIAYSSYVIIFGRRKPNVSVQKFKIIDHGVYETYTQALISSKLSTQLHSPTPDPDHDPLVTMKDFIDFLLSKLWERVQMDTCIAISTSFQLQLVYEGLTLLRTMLKEQQIKFDEEIRELTRVVTCDAGVIIFSLYLKDLEEVVVSISDLLQRIDRISQQVEGKDLSISDLLRRFNLTREEVEGNDLPRTNELGFIKFLLENLVEMTSSKACYGFQSQFQMVHDELSSLRYSLGEIEEVRNEQKELEALWNAGVKVAYRVELLIDQLVFADFQGSFSISFDSTIQEILKEIKSINSEIHHALDIKVKKESMTSNLVPSRSSVPIADEIVGLHDDAESIINRLTRGSKKLKIVAIVGMPGIGKTTLATKVYKDPSVNFHFHTRACCCVSQLFDKKKVLLELLNHIDANGNFEMAEQDGNFEMAEQDLDDKLRRGLKGKTYLIFLDDVWDVEVWNSLKASFPDDSCGSRIILTSRHRDVALLDEGPHFVRQLTEDESWELLQKKLSLRNDCTLELYELGKQIAANCKGLPLIVVVVAGLLANMGAEGWKKFLENISSVSSSDDHCMNTLELSYKHLPDYLKPCFLYFGLFPEDHEVSVKRLIWLWIAEGFVLKTESESLEDVARGYMMDLVGRSLVIVSEKRSRIGVKACRIHDLLHDFCRTKAKEENFFKLLEGGYEEFLCFKEPSYMRRLCVRSETEHFNKLRLFCPRLHSLLFFTGDDDEDSNGLRKNDISFIIPRYSRLRVLDILQYSLGGIPSEIGLFPQLKYLSVRGEIRDIPSSIGSLTNLETFILDSPKRCVPFPDTFWDLQKLRHLSVRASFCFPIKNLENFPHLYELQSCSGVMIGPQESIERLIRKFPNIRKFSCNLNGKDYNEILIPDSLSRLESLHLVVLSEENWISEESEVESEEYSESEEFKEYEVPEGSSEEYSECKEYEVTEEESEDHSEFEDLESKEYEVTEESEDYSESEESREYEVPKESEEHEVAGYRFEFDFPGNLRKLTLVKFSLHQSNISRIGKLSNLEVLKLYAVELHEKTWDMVEGEFSKLIFLKLVRSNIVRWTGSDDQFPCLQKLVLISCYDLEEIPCCFENVDALEMIEVFYCSNSVNTFFERIQAEQMEMGNSLPKIHISC